MNKLVAEISSAGFNSVARVTEYIDDFNKEVWIFAYNDRSHSLVLERYFKYYRATKRHKYRQVASFGSWDRRSDTLKEMPTVSHDVMVLAWREFGDALQMRIKDDVYPIFPG